MPDRRISHFLLREELGRGAYGTVYRGVHINEPDYQVAIKLMHAILAGDPAFLSGIRRERQILMSLVHPGIVQCRDMVFEDNQIALVLEYLKGQTLRERLNEHGPLPVAHVQSIVGQILQTLEYTHSQRPAIVHRDLKPSNIFLTADGTVKLLDFGLARAAETAQASQTGQLTGTWDYMAPEVWDGAAAVPATDLYAVGLIAWELLAGRPACPGRTLPQRMKWHLNTPLQDIREIRPDTPAPLANRIIQLTRKDPALRSNPSRIGPPPAVSPPPEPNTASTEPVREGRLLLRLSLVLAVLLSLVVVVGGTVAAIATDGFTRTVSQPSYGKNHRSPGAVKNPPADVGTAVSEPATTTADASTCADAGATDAFEAGAASWAACEWAAAVQHYEEGAAALGSQPQGVQRCAQQRTEAVAPHQEFLAQVASLRARGKCHDALAVLRQDAAGFVAQPACVDALVTCETAEKAARRVEVAGSEQRLQTQLTGVSPKVRFESVSGGWLWDISVEGDWRSMLMALENYTQYPNLAMQTVQTLTYVCGVIGKESSQTQWRSRNVLFRQAKSEACIARMSTASCRAVSRIQQSEGREQVDVYAAVIERFQECN
jgi:serine/threonine-protein kinase